MAQLAAAAHLDLVSICQQYGVILQRRGDRYVALCPFHTEKTPSFCVEPDWLDRTTGDRGSWRCYGACNMGGFARHFIALKEGRALPLVASRVRASHPAPRPERQPSTAEVAAMDFAVATWSEWLRSVPEANQYLAGRGLTSATVASPHHHLGYGGRRSGRLLPLFTKAGLSADTASATGAVRVDEKGSHERMWNRIVFPEVRSGHVLHATGRTLPGPATARMIPPPAKYTDLNYDPVIYGWECALAKDHDLIFVVEGQFCQLAGCQCDLAVVATGGAQISSGQARELSELAHRYDKTLVAWGDPDLAGRTFNAFLYGVGVTQYVDCGLFHDPAEILELAGESALREAARNLRPLTPAYVEAVEDEKQEEWTKRLEQRQSITTTNPIAA